MGARKTGKIHPEKPHRTSSEGGEERERKERERPRGGGQWEDEGRQRERWAGRR